MHVKNGPVIKKQRSAKIRIMFVIIISFSLCSECFRVNAILIICRLIPINSTFPRCSRVSFLGRVHILSTINEFDFQESPKPCGCWRFINKEPIRSFNILSAVIYTIIKSRLLYVLQKIDNQSGDFFRLFLLYPVTRTFNDVKAFHFRTGLALHLF